MLGFELTYMLDTDADPSFSESYTNLERANYIKLRIIFSIAAMATIAVIIFSALQNRQHAIDDYRQISKHALARIVASQTKLINDTQMFLMELSNAPALRNLSSIECHDFLRDTLALTPQYVNLGAPRANGELLCNASILAEPVNVSDRPYIRDALDNQSFSISAFQVDRVAQMTSLNFAYPIFLDPLSSKPVGAVVAVISLDWWNAELEAADLPEGTVAFILDRRNQVLAAYPPNDNLLGETVAQVGDEPDNYELSAPEIITSSDGIDRVFTRSLLFSGNRENQIFVQLGVPIDVGVSIVNREMIIQTIVIGGIWALIWLIAIKQLNRSILRPVQEMIAEFELIERQDASGANLSKFHTSNASPKVEQVTQSFRRIVQERAQAQADRVLQNKRMAALIDALPDTYFRIDRDGVILDCCASSRSDWIASPEDVIGLNLSEVFSTKTMKELNENLTEQRAIGGQLEYEYEFETNGQVRNFEARLCSVSGTTEIIIAIRNITARHVAKKRRKAAEAHLDRIITNLPGATISLNMKDPENPVPTYLSPQVEGILGYSVDDIYEDFTLLRSTHDPDDVEKMTKRLANSARSLKPFQHRYKVTTRTGEEKWVQTHVCAAKNPDGEIQIDGFIMDVTKEVHSQKQLVAQREVSHQAQKHESIGQLTGGVAHDFNNLLAIIMGNLELLRDELSDEGQLEHIDTSLRAILRGADLTRNMLAFARKARLEPKVIQLNKLVSETRSWSGRALPSNISIETSLLAGLWNIEADPSSTESALLNLILNARDAMPNGGKLTLETENVRVDQSYVDSRKQKLEPGRYVMLAVSDTGSGIPQDTLMQIFEPFFSTKPPGSGSGLGLSMIHGFMIQSGGTVQVYTELGFGTTFKLYFRAVDPNKNGPDHATELSRLAKSKGQRILVVEDEPEVLTVIVSILENAGYSVASANSGDLARDMFQADPEFDLLLTDIVIPGTLQGTTLSKALREITPELPAIFMSGYASEATVHGNGLRTQDVRLMKPVSRIDLLTAVAKALHSD